MKNKYLRMNKEERKKCRIEYYKSKKGREMKARFIRLNIIGISGLLFSLFLFISGYIQNELNWANWALIIILSSFSLIYIVGVIILKKKCFNNFAIKNLK